MKSAEQLHQMEKQDSDDSPKKAPSSYLLFFSDYFIVKKSETIEKKARKHASKARTIVGVSAGVRVNLARPGVAVDVRPPPVVHHRHHHRPRRRKPRLRPVRRPRPHRRLHQLRVNPTFDFDFVFVFVFCVSTTT